MDESRAIGNAGKIPWHLSEDLRLFKQRTLGHPILMGRATFESLGRPLPGRQNIIISRNLSYRATGASVIHDISELTSIDLIDREVMVIGGAQVYTLMLPYISKLYVSRVPGIHTADAYFPHFTHLFRKVSEPISYNGFSLYIYSK